MEKDELWTTTHRETDEEHDVRTRRALAKVMAADGACKFVLTGSNYGSETNTNGNSRQCYRSRWSDSIRTSSGGTSTIQDADRWGDSTSDQGDCAEVINRRVNGAVIIRPDL